MGEKRNFLKIFFLIFLFFYQIFSQYDTPRIASENGNLILETYNNYNISFISDHGHIFFNGVDLINILVKAPSSQKTQNEQELMSKIEQKYYELVAKERVFRDFNIFEQKLTKLEGDFNLIKSDLSTNECLSNPCMNGGTCYDGYLGYHCKCTEQWRGNECKEDIDECIEMINTSSGCKNGATCVNKVGGFDCICPPHLYGPTCQESHEDCLGTSDQSLCGHGTCHNVARKQPNEPNFKCFCDPGWKVGSNNPACVEDIDECSQGAHPCSQDPPVVCFNTPGSFACGQCPQGFTGNGFICKDIDECALENGGCSKIPFVPCNNTRGSFLCGPCPPGYQGDGRRCSIGDPCAFNNGGCSPFATCFPKNSFSQQVECRCKPGYNGNGIGVNGCQRQIDTLVGCQSNPCLRGICVPGFLTYSCICPHGYYGNHCEHEGTPCSSSPCFHNATCQDDGKSYVCICPNLFTGKNCETTAPDCTGTLYGSGGVKILTQTSSRRSRRCTFNFKTTLPNQIVLIDMKFYNFSTESKVFDINGNQIVSSIRGPITLNTNLPYVKIYGSYESGGYEMHWRSDKRECGNYERLNLTSTTLSFDGLLSGNASYHCRWSFRGSPGSNFKIVFNSFRINEDCRNNYLEISSGLYYLNSKKNFCGTNLPNPVTVTNSDMTIIAKGTHLSPDIKLYITNFKGECGGTQTGWGGTIMSPINTGETHSCSWTLWSPGAHAIDLTFTEMSTTEVSPGCYHDKVQIFSKHGDSFRLLASYCSLFFSSPLTVHSHTVKIDVVTKGIFKLNWKNKCDEQIRDDQGYIKSPMFPAKYPPSASCSYYLNSSESGTVELEIVHFDLSQDNSCSDYLTINNKIYCQANITNSGHFSRAFALPSPVTINFVSKGTTQGTGFMIRYKQLGNRVIVPGVLDGEESLCGGILTGNGGILNSPIDEDLYPNDLNCTWVIQAPEDHVVKLIFHSFDVEFDRYCSFDYILVYNGFDPHDSEGKFCGKNLPEDITSKGPILSVQFVTDESDVGDGFKASYIFLDKTKSCKWKIKAGSGEVTSPSYPNPYPNNLKCEWLIETDPLSSIFLNFSLFELEDQNSCNYDYLEIRNGKTTDSPLIGKYCGTSIPETLTSSGNSLLITFVTDTDESLAGFNFTYEEVSTGCGSEMGGMKGFISNPNYPLPLEESAECTWNITVAKGNRIRLTFIDSLPSNRESNCIKAKLSVHENYHENCSKNFPTSVSSKDHQLIISMESEYFHPLMFRAHYLLECGNEMGGFEGEIQSPNYPDGYPSGMDCTWKVKGESRNTIEINILEFVSNTYSTNCLDYIEILDEYKKVIRKLCNLELGSYAIYEVASSVAFIHFVSEPKIEREEINLFKIKYRMIGCGGLLTEETGELTSPNFPKPYEGHQDCSWLISTKLGTRVQISIHEIDIENYKDCDADSLKIYGGRDTKSFLLANLCHKDSDYQEIVTSGNSALLRFISDHSDHGKGFNITWKAVEGGCGGKLFGSKGNLVSPNYPNPYEHMSDCLWEIKALKYMRVNLTFVEMHIEESHDCEYDYIEIDLNPGSEPPETEKICGKMEDKSRVFTSFGERMLVRLVSDESDAERGFKAEWSSLCGGEFNLEMNSEITITSPNWPGEYLANQDCSWIFKPESKVSYMNIFFSEFYVDINGPCINDYVEIKKYHPGDRRLFETDQEGRKYCGTSPPNATLAMGSDYIVSFHSDDYTTYTGFVFTVTTAQSVCGFNYKAESGIISYLYFPFNPQLTKECMWTVEGSQGSSIHLTFSLFDINGLNCESYVELRTETSRKLCKKEDTQSNFIISNNNLTIYFKSNKPEEQFSLYYKINYGGDLLNWKSGTVESPMFPKKYKDSENVKWVLRPPRGQSIRFFFNHIDLEGDYNCYDYVEITSGQEQPLKFCENKIPDPFIVTQTPIIIRFITDESNERTGFSLTWKADDVYDHPFVSTYPPDSDKCGGKIIIEEGVTEMLRSPYYPSSYPPNLNCTWMINSLDGFLIIFVNHLDLGMSIFGDCYSDHLLISKYVDGKWETVTKLCDIGVSEPLKKIYLSSRTAKISFMSYTVSSRTGFHLEIDATCDRVISDPAGVVSSHGYPNSYSDNKNCTFRLNGVKGKTLTLEFVDLDLSCGRNGDGDKLLIFDGEGIEAPVESMCNGTDHVTKLEDFISSGDVVRLQLVTNGNEKTGRGFKIKYKPTTSYCGDVVQLNDQYNSHTFHSPEHPGFYPPILDCIWIFTGSSRIKLTFETFDLEIENNNCTGDWLEIRDGDSKEDPLLGRFCGKSSIPLIIANENSLYMRFVANDHGSNTGFKATVSLACGEVMQALQGTIMSPNYPDPYPSQEICQWVIRGPENHFLTLSFEDVQIKDCNDKLFVRDHNATGTILAEVCGSEKPHLISESNVVVVQLIANNSYFSSKGFKLNYMMSYDEVCGGEESSSNGIIYVPSLKTPRKKFCKWIIRAPEGNRVKISDGDVDYNTKRERKIKYFNGLESDSPETGFAYYGPTSSSDNILRVEVTLAKLGGGFELSYTTTEPSACSKWINREERVIDILGSGECNFIIQNPSHSDKRSISFSFKKSTDTRTVLNCDYKIQFYEYSTNRLFKVFCESEEIPEVPLITPSSAVRIRVLSRLFHSFPVVVYNFTDCGQILTTEGTLTSPGYPDLVSQRGDCGWILKGPVGSKILFNSIEFKKSETEVDCNKIYFEIKTGLLSDSPVFKKICNTTTLRSMSIESNEARIIFHADGLATLRIIFTFSRAGCPGITHVFGREGLIKGLLWPDESIISREYCTWEVQVPIGFHVSPSFQSPFGIGFSEPNCQAYVSLTSEFGEEQKFCGTSIPQNISEMPTNKMKVKLVLPTSFNRRNRGFGLSFTAVCGQNFTQESGRIILPTTDIGECPYFLLTPRGKKVNIIINRGLIDREDTNLYYYSPYSLYGHSGSNCATDKMTIKSLSENKSFIICYSKQTLSVSGPVEIKIIRTSNRSHDLDLQFSTSNCNFSYTNETGLIKSSFFGYTHSPVNCRYEIKINNNLVYIVFRIKWGIIRKIVSCDTNNLMFVDSQSEETIKRVCFDGYPRSSKFSSKTSHVIIHHTRIAESYEPGYEINYNTAFKCGSHLTSGPGSFEPVKKRGGLYESNLNCEWFFNASAGQVVEINIPKMNFSENNEYSCFDKLELYDGEFNPKPTLSICINSTNFNYVSAHNRVKLVFKSNFEGEAEAFKGDFKFVPKMCGGVIELEENVEKPIYLPENLEKSHEIRCTWKVTAAEFKAVLMDIEEFNVSSDPLCQSSFLKISEGKDEQKLCGQGLRDHLVKKSPAFLFYYAKPGFQKNKFKIKTKNYVCDQRFEGESGKIDKIKFYNKCNYTIKTRPNTWLAINFFKVYESNANQRANCSSFFFQVWIKQNGVWKMQEMFCKTKFFIFETNEVLISFQLTGNTERDFSILYHTVDPAKKCGGKIANINSGSIATPDYPLAPNSSFHCIWNISTNGKTDFRLFFKMPFRKYDQLAPPCLNSTDSSRIIFYSDKDKPSCLSSEDHVYSRTIRNIKNNHVIIEYFSIKDDSKNFGTEVHFGNNYYYDDYYDYYDDYYY